MAIYKTIEDPRIHRLLRCFEKFGFNIETRWPEILLSPERKYYKRFMEENKGKVQIDKVFGEYFPEKRIIVIYYLEIEEFTTDYHRDFRNLFIIILVHEFSHWITHRLSYNGNHRWNLKKYINADESVHEGYAQLLTYWAIREYAELFNDFEWLNEKHQPEVYRIYKKFQKCHPDLMINSLKELRKPIKANWNSVELLWSKILKRNPDGCKLTKGMFEAKDIVFQNLDYYENEYPEIMSGKNLYDIDNIDLLGIKAEIRSCFN